MVEGIVAGLGVRQLQGEEGEGEQGLFHMLLEYSLNM